MPSQPQADVLVDRTYVGLYEPSRVSCGLVSPARCGSTGRAGRRGGLLTVWPGLGQHGPGARGPPRRVPPWGEAHAGRGHDVLRPGATGPLILIPPEDRGPVLGHSRACRMAGPGICEVSRRWPAWRAARRAGRPRAAGPPDGRSGGSCGSRTRPSGAGCAPGRRRPEDAVRLWPAAFPCLPQGWTCAGRGRTVGLSAGVWFLPGLVLPPGSRRDPAFPRDSRDGRLSVGSCDD